MKKVVVITGVSSGIGRDAAESLLKKGYQVFGSVRKAADGAALQAELGDDFIPLLFDVTNVAAIADAASQVEAELQGQGLSALVNNAGVCTPGPLLHVEVEEVRQAIEINAIGLLNVTRAFLPMLGAGNDSTVTPGRVINVTSVNGAVAIPIFGGYNASKFAAQAINDSLRRELSIYGIHVIAIEPGEVSTDIQGKIDMDAMKRQYGNTDYWPTFQGITDRLEADESGLLTPREVSEKIIKAIESSSPRADYPMHILWRLNWLLPTRLMDRVMNKFSGIKSRL